MTNLVDYAILLVLLLLAFVNITHLRWTKKHHKPHKIDTLFTQVPEVSKRPTSGTYVMPEVNLPKDWEPPMRISTEQLEYRLDTTPAPKADTLVAEKLTTDRVYFGESDIANAAAERMAAFEPSPHLTAHQRTEVLRLSRNVSVEAALSREAEILSRVHGRRSARDAV
jgi:hypothetical protein